MQRTPDQLSQIVEEVAAHAEEHDRTGEFPAKGIRAVHDAGLLTLTALGQGDPSGGYTPHRTTRSSARQVAPYWKGHRNDR